MVGRISLELSGADNYTINLNGTIINTTDSEISLDLAKGINHLQVTTDMACQGKYSEIINNTSNMLVYPNPIKEGNQLYIMIGDNNLDKINIKLFSVIGELLMSKPIEVVNGEAVLNMSNISTGMYMLIVNTGKEQTNYKVLKKSTDGKFQKNPKKYKYNYFFNYMTDILRNSLNNFDYYVKKYENYTTLSNNSLDILKCFKNEPEVNLQTRDIVNKLGIPRRTVIYSLNSLSDKGFIQRLGQGRALRYKITF